MIQGRVQVGISVSRPVVADGFLHFRIGTQNTVPALSHGIINIGSLLHAVSVEAYLLGGAVIGDSHMGPFSHREELGPAALHADFVRLACIGPLAYGKRQRRVVILHGQIPAVGVILLLIPGNNLLPGDGRVGIDPERKGQILRLELLRCSQIQVGAAGEADSPASSHAVHKLIGFI